MKKSCISFILFQLFYLSGNLFGQGFNHVWLLGNAPSSTVYNGRAFFDQTSSLFISEYRKMSFEGTESNICDANGNYLMSSNGIWIANANNDTMLNGSGLNPGGITANSSYGLSIPYANITLPYPNDSNKLILFHHTAYNNSVSIPALELFYSVIDLSLDNGLGGVVSKNNIAFSDTLGWGIAACKHANGRDWWIVMMKDSSNDVFKVLLTPTGIDTVEKQTLNYFPQSTANLVQLTFSQDGSRFISTTYDNPVDRNSSIIICDFDRCSGNFSNTQVIQLTTNRYLWGLAFSSSGNYAYACASNYIFQVDVNTLAVDTVAVYDGFISPGPSCCPTQFWNMYLAANGKIYLTSGSSTQHLHEMNYPDSVGILCDVQQHAIDLIDYLNFRTVPNHPNYYLGCDTTSGCACLNTGLTPGPSPNGEGRMRLFPNPTNGIFSISYLLPQSARGGKSGVFEVFDINGKKVFSYNLPPWSTLQQFSLSHLPNGIYQCFIKSGGVVAGKKLVIMK